MTAPERPLPAPILRTVSKKAVSTPRIRH